MRPRSRVPTPGVEGQRPVIVTLTPNTGLDRVIFVPYFEWGQTIRATTATLAMGGKATDVSFVLAELGYASLALGFAAGLAGELMAQMLEERGVTCDLVWVEGETRTNTVLINTRTAQQSTITLPGLHVQPAHVEALTAKLKAYLPQASCLVLGGSLPQGVHPELYSELISLARAARVPTLFDASGAGLRAGASARPTLLKLNRAEMEQLSGRALPTDEAMRWAAREWVTRGVERVVVTMGPEGAWASSADEEYFVPSLDIEPLNTAGAGDGLMAGLAVGLAEGWSWPEALRLSAATAAAVCLTPGTAECRRQDVERFLPQVQIIPA